MGVIHNVNHITTRAMCAAPASFTPYWPTCHDCRMVVLYGMKVFEPEDGTYPPDRKDVE